MRNTPVTKEIPSRREIGQRLEIIRGHLLLG
jgi:hypothetical protein